MLAVHVILHSYYQHILHSKHVPPTGWCLQATCAQISTCKPVRVTRCGPVSVCQSMSTAVQPTDVKVSHRGHVRGAVVLWCYCVVVLRCCGAVVLICCCVVVLHMPRSHVYTSVLTAYPVTASVMHNSRAVSTPLLSAQPPCQHLLGTHAVKLPCPFPCRSHNALVHASCRHVQRKATWQEWHRGQVCKCFCGTLPRGHYV